MILTVKFLFLLIFFAFLIWRPAYQVFFLPLTSFKVFVLYGFLVFACADTEKESVKMSAASTKELIKMNAASIVSSVS